MGTVEKSIEVDRDVTTVYNQWTQFEDFPHFMDGVEEVEQRDDAHLHWKTEIATAEREFDAEITEQEPDQVIAWRATGETRHDGRVTFEPLDGSGTRVNLELGFEPQDAAEKAADAGKIIEQRVEGDLKRFKKFIESKPQETGAWRGEIR